MDAENSDVAAAVGYFWNKWASLQDDIVLIICGSATSWMITNVIDSKGGLHDRITEEMPIHPFCLREVEAYLKEHQFVWNRQMALQAYMVFGGIPYYLSLLDKDDELDKDEYDKINRRRTTFIKETGLRHASWLTMITTAGLAKGMYSEMIQSQVVLDDLFV